jgi:hypothetical protein
VIPRCRGQEARSLRRPPPTLYTKLRMQGVSGSHTMENDETSSHDPELYRSTAGLGGPRRSIGVRDMRVLVANEPTVYREVISAAFRELRPGVEVFTAEPEVLDREFSRLKPQLVVCSRLTRRVELDARVVWVLLYPHGASHAVVGCLDGRRTTLARIDFDTLLSILDDTRRMGKPAVT